MGGSEHFSTLPKNKKENIKCVLPEGISHCPGRSSRPLDAADPAVLAQLVYPKGQKIIPFLHCFDPEVKKKLQVNVQAVHKNLQTVNII